MITGGDLRQSRLDVGYKTFTKSRPDHLPWQNKLFSIRFFAVAAIFTALCMQTAGVSD